MLGREKQTDGYDIDGAGCDNDGVECDSDGTGCNSDETGCNCDGAGCYSDETGCKMEKKWGFQECFSFGIVVFKLSGGSAERDGREIIIVVIMMNNTYEINFKYNNNEKIKFRKSIFLDTNVWIDLVESKDLDAKETRKLLVKYFESGKIFCPLSVDTFIEFLRQNYNSLKKISEFVDKLSFNLSLKLCNQLYILEIRNYIVNIINGTNLPISINDIFVPYACTLSNTVKVNLPYDKNNSQTEIILQIFHDIVINSSLSQYLYFMQQIIPQRQSIDNFDFQKHFIERKKIAKGDKNLMKEIEEETVVLKIVYPLIKEELRRVLFDEILIDDSPDKKAVLNKLHMIYKHVLKYKRIKKYKN